LGAAGADCFSGFYFFEETGAAETTGGFESRWQGEMGKIGAPAAAFREAGHGGTAFDAEFLHGESMARGVGKVKKGKKPKSPHVTPACGASAVGRREGFTPARGGLQVLRRLVRKSKTGQRGKQAKQSV
jgi:hypothetical protein